MQYFDFTVAPNKVAPISCQGQRFYYASGSAGGADSAIKVRFGTSGQSIILRPGQGVRAPAGTAISDTAYIENYAGAAPIFGMVFIGDDDIIDNRITGSVEVVDGGKARSNAGVAFASAVLGQPSVGFRSCCQLWNPVGSGKNVIISKLFLSTTVQGIINIGTNNAVNGAGGGVPASKRASGSVAVARHYPDNVSVPVGFNYLGQVILSVNLPFIYQLAEPVLLPPGYGMCTWHNTVDTPQLSSTFEFIEELI